MSRDFVPAFADWGGADGTDRDSAICFGQVMMGCNGCTQKHEYAEKLHKHITSS